MKKILKQLAEQSTSGDLYVRLAEMYLCEHEYGLAFGAVNRGLEKGHLSDTHAAQQLYVRIGDFLGVSCFTNYEDAVSSLSQ